MTKQSREKILTTAMRLFYFQGFHGTGLNQILKESGAPKGSLYHYFPEGKEQLAEEAIKLSRQLIGDVIQHYMMEKESVEEALTAHILAMAELFDQENGVKENSHLMMPFGLLAAETAFMNERLREACSDTYQYWESLYFGKLVRNGYRASDATLISQFISTLIEGAVTLSLTKKSNDPLIMASSIIPTILQNYK